MIKLRFNCIFKRKMVLMYLFILLFACTCGFLFEGNSQTVSTTNSPVSDDHFNMLLKLLVEQRQNQKDQGEMIKQLQQELITTKIKVTEAIHDLNKTSCKETGSEEIRNLTRSLQTQIDTVNVSQIRQKTIVTDNMNKIQVLEHEFSTFNNLNSSVNLLSVSNVLNVTEHLNLEIQETNYKLAEIGNDANARKNDFIALFNKADLTERKMENISQKLEQKLKDWNKRVILVAGATAKDYKDRQTILFGSIYIATGVGNIDSLKASGIFVCEKSGVYQVSVYVVSNARTSKIEIYKNDKFLGDAFGNLDSYYETLTFISVEQIDVNDRLKVIVDQDMHVYGGRESVITILQIA